MAHEHAQDDGFHEIQLNGKQLVFLFMAATVVSVVIFLCGVLVGRGVRSERAASGAHSAGAAPVTTPDVIVAKEPAAQAPAGSDPTTAPPPPAVGELSYFNRLEKRGQSAENLKASEKPVVAGPVPAPAEKPVKRDAPAPPPETAAAAPRIASPPPVPAAKAAASKPAAEALPPPTGAGAEPAGPGFALQVTALRERAEAEAIVKRLSAKGYSAYVLQPANGAASVYRVRVGKFKTRREAEAIATKLQKEERFKPWITR